MENLETFDVNFKVIQGKKIPVIKCRTERIVREDGRVDVVIHAPVLTTKQKLQLLGEK